MRVTLDLIRSRDGRLEGTAAEASLTVGVLDAPARSGEGRYRGTCSNHLAAVPEGGTVFALVREPSIAFRPPENYADELARYEKEGVARLLTACSRELLQRDAVVYVCGNTATMAPGVRAALASVFRARTLADAEAWFAGLRAGGRYLEDIWGESAVV